MLMSQVWFFLYILETTEKSCLNLQARKNDFPGPLVLTIMSSHVMQCTLSLGRRVGVIDVSIGAKKHATSVSPCAD